MIEKQNWAWAMAISNLHFEVLLASQAYFKQDQEDFKNMEPHFRISFCRKSTYDKFLCRSAP